MSLGQKPKATPASAGVTEMKSTLRHQHRSTKSAFMLDLINFR